MEFYLDAWRQYAKFSGRATRTQFWWFVLIHTALIAGLFLLYFVLAHVVGVTGGFASHPVTYLLAMAISAYFAASLPPALAVTVRRLHDAGRSGWWLCLALVPVIGILALVVLLTLDSQRWRPNRWGPQPTGW